MDIAKALELKVGNSVRFPADRGDPAGYGKVEHIDPTVATSFNGTKYIWVVVRGPNAAATWPSNRLSRG